MPAASSVRAIPCILSTILPCDAQRAFASSTKPGYAIVVLVLGPRLGVRSVSKIAVFANARLGKLFHATDLAEGAQRLAAERFKLFKEIEAKHFGYDVELNC